MILGVFMLLYIPVQLSPATAGNGISQFNMHVQNHLTLDSFVAYGSWSGLT